MPEDLKQHETIIGVNNVDKDFVVGKNTIQALKSVNLNVKSTDFIILFGPSGCGKSTLFNIILGLDKPTKGDVTIRGTKIYDLDDDERAMFRAKKIGMIYQMPYWIKSLKVIENVALPLMVEGEKETEAIKHAQKMLSDIGIADLADQMPTQLSGGQQQKVGLARALVSNPWILMADEPTGNLDSVSGGEIMKIFRDLNQKYKRTILMVTHNEEYWDFGTRRIEIRDGSIVKDTNHG
ncbi:MAG: ABC transporter ATP-binding protein [Patescibacteria group bacterium]|jgi:putative ABC transport system ATP-binding protein